MAIELGKVGMRMRGAWSSSATYEVLDAVSYNNGTYIAKQDMPANTAPTNTTYWQPAIDAAIIGSDSIAVPGVSNIIAGLNKIQFYQHSVANNGTGAGLVGTSGFYLVIATSTADASAYYFGVIYKASGSYPICTVLANNKITTGSGNAGGTQNFKYNDAVMGDEARIRAFRFTFT